MAFTVNLDQSTERLLGEIKRDLDLKTKTKTIQYLIHNHQSCQRLAEHHQRLLHENEILCDINFANKVTDGVLKLLAKKL